MVWQERRSSTRHLIELPIRYRILADHKRSGHTASRSAHPYRIKNISETGLLFLSIDHFEIGTRLELTLPVKDRILKVEGRICHVIRDPESGLYRTGIAFQNVDYVFKTKMAEQVYQIDQYRKELSSREGRAVSEAEAAERWIKNRSKDFAKFYKL